MDYFIADSCCHYTHNRTEQVEETERKVGKCCHVEDSGLCHSATVPWDKGRGNGYGILGSAAQQSALITSPTVSIAKHASCKDDADVLVGCYQIHEQPRADR